MSYRGIGKSTTGDGLVVNPQPNGVVYTDTQNLFSTTPGTDNEVLVSHTNGPPTFDNVPAGGLSGVVSLENGGTAEDNRSVVGFFAGPPTTAGPASFRALEDGDFDTDLCNYIGEQMTPPLESYVNQAETAAENAETSETNAHNSATDAANSATEATNSAAEAAGSATTAGTEAGTATTQAGIATTAATTASGSAVVATTQAGIATTQAGNASTSASQAQSYYNSITAAQNANTVYSGPTSGAATTPTFRALTNADIPSINLSSGVNNVLGVGNGGLGTNASFIGINQVFASPTNFSGAPSFRALIEGDIPLINLSTKVIGVLGVANGGTGTIGLLIPANQVFASPTIVSGQPGFRSLEAGDLPPINAGLTGVLPIANGGTNVASIAHGGVLVSDGSGGLTVITGSNPQVLTSNGTSAPSFQSISTIIPSTYVTASTMTTNDFVFATGTNAVGTPNPISWNGKGVFMNNSGERSVYFTTAATSGYTAGFQATTSGGNVLQLGIDNTIGFLNADPGNAVYWVNSGATRHSFYSGTVPGTLIGRIDTTGSTFIDVTITNTKTANTFFGAPSGSTGVPSFRTLVAADIPPINAGLTGVLPIANGGTNVASIAHGGVLVSDGSGGLTVITGSNPQVLTSNGTSAPSFQSISTIIPSTYVTASTMTTNDFVFATGTNTVGTPNPISWNGQGMVMNNSGQRSVYFTAATTPYTAGFQAATSGGTVQMGIDGIGMIQQDTNNVVYWANTGATRHSFYTGNFGGPYTLVGRLDTSVATFPDVTITTTKTANTFWASPSGSAGVPSFRTLVSADIPTLAFTKITGTVPVNQGGTNLTSVTNGGVLVSDGAGGVTVITGSNPQVLTSNGASAPSFQSISAIIPSTYVSASSMTNDNVVFATGANTIGTPYSFSRFNSHLLVWNISTDYSGFNVNSGLSGGSATFFAGNSVTGASAWFGLDGTGFVNTHAGQVVFRAASPANQFYWYNDSTLFGSLTSNGFSTDNTNFFKYTTGSGTLTYGTIATGGSTPPTSVTYSDQSCNYVVNGKIVVVIISFKATYAAAGAAGYLVLAGLPNIATAFTGSSVSLGVINDTSVGTTFSNASGPYTMVQLGGANPASKWAFYDNGGSLIHYDLSGSGSTTLHFCFSYMSV